MYINVMWAMKWYAKYMRGMTRLHIQTECVNSKYR